MFIEMMIARGAIAPFHGAIPPAPRERQPDATALAVERIGDLLTGKRS